MDKEETLPDYYQILNVPKSSDPETIKQQYRRLVREYHPDVSTDKLAAHEKFVQIVEAYQTLIDPICRAAYDERMFGKGKGDEEKEFAKPAEAAMATAEVGTEREAEARVHPFSWEKARRLGESIAVLIEAEQWFVRGEYRAAVDLCKQVLQKEPDNARAWFLLAEIFESAGRVDDAVTAYSYAIQFEPRITFYQRRLERLMEAIRAGKGFIPKQPSESAASVTVSSVKQKQTLPTPTTILTPEPSFAFRLLCLTIPIGVAVVCLYAFPILSGPSLFPETHTPRNAFLFLPFCGFAFGFLLQLGKWLKSFEQALFFGDPFTTPRSALLSGLLVGIVSLLSIYVGLITYLIIALLHESLSVSVLVAFVVSFALMIAFALVSSATGFILLWGGGIILAGFLIGWALGSMGGQAWWE